MLGFTDMAKQPSMARTTAWYRRIAPIYDGLCRPLYARPRRGALQMLALQPGETVLDLGCGTGLSLPGLSKAVGPSGKVIALDATSAMLKRARRRCERQGLNNVQFLAQDLLTLDPADSALEPLPAADAIVCSYVLAITPQWREFFAAAQALQKPGGRLVLVDTRPLQGAWRWLNPLVVPFANWSGAGDITRPTWQLGQAESLRSYWGGFVFVALV
jgi:S-adenosylmethionine-diacylgycerolhomoserine-N-methlytransferase